MVLKKGVSCTTAVVFIGMQYNQSELHNIVRKTRQNLCKLHYFFITEILSNYSGRTELGVNIILNKIGKISLQK